MEIHPKLVILLLAALGIASVFSKDPFLGLDIIPGTIRAIRQHRVLGRSCEIFRAYGNTFRVKELFKVPSLRHRLELFMPLLGRGIFNTDGQHWASSRALIRPSFAREQVADLSLLEKLIQDFFLLLPRDGTTVDLQELFFRYTIDSATDLLFGQSVGALKKSQSGLAFADALQYALKAIPVRDMLGPLDAVYRDRKADECNRICRDFVQQYVEEAAYAAGAKKEEKESRMTETKRRYILSHELASRTSDKQRMVDELINVLLADRDTTGSLLGNLFFMLAKNPVIWAKLRAEVDVLQNRPPTYKELRGLRYVQCCVNESLRLHPVVPTNKRKAMRDTVLPLGGGKVSLSPVFVPAGTLVGYNIYAMHRRTDFYGPDAEEFRPERWEDGKLQPRWGYLPFNGGPRICLGQRYALTEASYVLVRMAQEFRGLESRDPGSWEEGLVLTVCPRNGTKVGLIP